MENQSSLVDLRINDDVVLWNLNADNFRIYIPAVIITFILEVIGLSGNGMVIYVYQIHFRKTTANLFIKTLAVLDVACCLIGMSFEISDLCFSLMNGEPISCKVFRGLEQTFEFISGEILLCIAIDRYMHVCKPLAVFTLQNARRMVFASVVFGVLATSPTFLLVGRAEIYYKGIKTSQCTFDAHYNNGPFKSIYYNCLNVIIGVTFLSMIILYIRIWSELCNWQKFHLGETLMKESGQSRPKQTSENFCIASNSNRKKSTIEAETVDVTRIFYNHMPNTSPSMTARQQIINENANSERYTAPPLHTRLERLKRKRLVKPVVILFSVTVVFVVSFLPYCVLMLIHTSGKFDPTTLTVRQRQMWEVAYKSYFLSNALNPLIYATLDRSFKTMCYNILFVPGYRAR